MIKDSGKGQYHPARENVCGMTRVTQKTAVCCVLSRNDAFSYISHDERYANCGEILQNSPSEPFYFFLRQRQPQFMALYINGRPVNPIVQFLGTALVIAAVIGLGILLLPLIGGILVFLLLCFVGLALYGWYWRWRHGDPVEALKRRMAREIKRPGCAPGIAQRPVCVARRWWKTPWWWKKSAAGRRPDVQTAQFE